MDSRKKSSIQGRMGKGEERDEHLHENETVSGSKDCKDVVF